MHITSRSEHMTSVTSISDYNYKTKKENEMKTRLYLLLKKHKIVIRF